MTSRRALLVSIGVLYFALSAHPATVRAGDDADEAAREGAKFLGSASLIKYGFTFGIAGVAITNKGLGKERKQDDIGITAMPYVAISPAYLYRLARGASITNSYCAAKAITLKAAEAQKAANAEAKAQARLSYRGGDHEADFDKLKTDDQADAVRKLTGWDVDYAGRCGWTWITVFGGFPASYNANFKDDGVRNHDTTTRGAFGLAFTPIPYFSVLLGISRIAVKYDLTDESSELRRGWAYVTGIGGNVDIFGELFK